MSQERGISLNPAILHVVLLFILSEEFLTSLEVILQVPRQVAFRMKQECLEKAVLDSGQSLAFGLPFNYVANYQGPCCLLHLSWLSSPASGHGLTHRHSHTLPVLAPSILKKKTSEERSSHLIAAC